MFNKYINNFQNSSSNFVDLINQEHFTFSHQLSGLSNEKSLSVTNPVRAYRDSTTDAFVKNILNNETLRFLFLDYTFHLINSKICTEINDYLTSNHYAPLTGEENVYFVFKGGNVMNHFMELHLASIENIFKKIPLKNVSRKYQIKLDDPTLTNFDDYFTKLKENFKISDVDYSLYVRASSHARFLLIHEGSLRILARALDQISIHFDSIYESMKPAQLIDVLDTNDDVNDEDPFVERYHQLKELMIDERFTPYWNIIKKELNNTPFNQISAHKLNKEYFDAIMKSILDGVEFVNQINTDTSYLTKIYQLITVIQYLQTIKYLGIENSNYNINVSNVTNLDSELKSHLDNLLMKKYDHLRVSEFYTVEKINQLKTDLMAALDKLVNEERYEEINNGLKVERTKYQLVKTPQMDDLQILKRGNFIVKSNNNPLEQELSFNTDESKFHYLTFNNIINITRATNKLNFDLMRIKFNVKAVNHIFKVNDKLKDVSIPSEFIDVSIPFYDDVAGQHYINHSAYHLTKISLRNETIKRNIIVQAYGLDDLVHDLSYVLFGQNYFVPWLDPKYNKRIIRFIFNGIVDAYHHDCLENQCTPHLIKIYKDLLDFSTQMLEFVQGKTKYPYEVCNKFIATTNHSLDHIKSVIDDTMIHYPKLLFKHLLTIDEHYEQMEDILRMTMVCAKLLTVEEQWLFINKYRNDYKYVPIDRAEFAEYMKDFAQHFQDMLQTIVDNGYKILFVYEQLLTIRKAELKHSGETKIQHPEDQITNVKQKLSDLINKRKLIIY